MASIELNKGQMDAKKKLVRWWISHTQQTFKLQGPAGTGKTTIIFSLIDEIGLDVRTEVLFVTYVGKATLPLRRSGLQGKTIHSTIYDFGIERVVNEKGQFVLGSDDRYKVKSTFRKRKHLGHNIKLIVVDEAGMVPDDMKRDLESFGLPIIAIGDEDQLPPVFGKSSFIKNPDARLWEIVRQKQGDPIIELADMARKGIDIPVGVYGPRCIVAEDEVMTHNWIFNKSNIVICGKNKTREDINNRIRYDIKGYRSEFPMVGETLVCRKNNWKECMDDIPLINGMFGTVEHVYRETFNGKKVHIDFQPDFIDDDYFPDIALDYTYLTMPMKEKANYRYGDGNRFEFGYASTCHLVQGSQYGAVMVLEEKIGDEDFHRKWLYTALTRAQHTLLLIKRKPKPKKYNGYTSYNWYDKVAARR